MNQAVMPAMLSGLRVLDLTRNLPGPFATRMLADLGATIVKVEPPEGDPARPLGGLFDALNHGKECRRIDFKNADDLAQLRGWVAASDVIVDSFRPGVMQALGLDYATLSALNPKLVAVSITGYGQQGPWAAKAGHDTVGSVLASDAFFPFRDGIDAAAKAGATAVVQPGGSVRDEEVIAAANEHGMAMIFTGMRHFRH